MNTSVLQIAVEKPSYRVPFRERLRVWYANWKNRHVEAFRTLEKALQDDPEYARAWHANFSMSIYDESRPQCICNFNEGHELSCPIVRAHNLGCFYPVSIEQCNSTADRIMRHFST